MSLKKSFDAGIFSGTDFGGQRCAEGITIDRDELTIFLVDVDFLDVAAGCESVLFLGIMIGHRNAPQEFEADPAH